MKEKEKVFLTVRSHFRDAAADAETAAEEMDRFEKEALLERRGGSVIVQTVRAEDSAERLSLVYDAGTGSLKVLRTGDAALKMDLVRGRRSEAVFSAPSGKLALEVETLRLEETEGSGFSLALEYRTYSGGRDLGSFSMEIRAEAVPKGGPQEEGTENDGR